MITDEYPAHTPKQNADAIYETAAKRMVNLAIDENDTINRLVAMGRIEFDQTLLKEVSSGMKEPKYLMEPNTGYVETEEDLLAEMHEWEAIDEDGNELQGEELKENQQEQFDSLIEVVKNEQGDWVEPSELALAVKKQGRGLSL